MKAKPVITRQLGDEDTDTAFEYYVSEVSADIAVAFINELEKAYAQLGRFPLTGSPHYGDELTVSDIPVWPLDRFPYLLVFVDHDDCVEIWRVLHRRMDIPSRLGDEDRT